MSQTTVDLSSHINQTVERGHPADFPVSLEPLFYRRDSSIQSVHNRVAVVRQDTGQVLAVVSDRYALIPHQRILDLIREAIGSLDVGPVPRGIYVDRGGARMRAVLKFPALARPVNVNDDICPCLKIRNSYDGTTQISIHIGAFRFVCTNLAVGGGGAFAGGFMSVHAGEIPIGEAAQQLAAYLESFAIIVGLYQVWAGRALDRDALDAILAALPRRPADAIRTRIEESRAPSVYDAYNVATHHATHEMRSFRGAFQLLERINQAFQETFPPPTA